jgi:FMN phosphatase YigB (HAD superfamily)
VDLESIVVVGASLAGVRAVQALRRVGFAGRITLVGAERVLKPEPAIFELVLERFGLEASATLFVDDSARNVEAAAALGFVTHRFTDAPTLAAFVDRVVPALSR